ncbi:MAG: PilW family protein [Pseudomonadota bacterium]|nr:PilW family protein [Pseudomonadota bacterium]
MLQVQRGYTIIEVMIALTLSLILTAGLTQIFVANSRTFNVTEASARTQETGRLALSVVAREIRNADYWGCQGSEGVLQGNIENMLNPDPNFDTDLLLRGLDAEDGTGPDGSDLLSLGGLAGNSAIRVTFQPSTTAANLRVNDTSSFSDNDIIIVTNCRRGHMFQITNVQSTNSVVVHNTGNVEEGPGNATKNIDPSYNDDPDGASVYQPRQQRFYLRDNATTGRRELVVDGVSILGGNAGAVGTISAPIALLEDIRNFQLQLGRDTTGNGRVDTWSDPGDPLHADQALAIRMSILVRSPDDGVTDGGQSYCYPGWLDCAADSSLLTTSGTNDTFLYRVYTSTATLRNRI